MPETELTIKCAPLDHNGKTRLTICLNDDVLAVDTINLTDARARARFVDQVCRDRPGIRAADLEAKLLELAAEVTGAEEAVDLDAEPELDVASVIRPERAITPEVSTLAVNTLRTSNGELLQRPVLYVRHADGRRERMPMPRFVDVGEDKKLWIFPQPEPTDVDLKIQLGWSREARERWLAGQAAPAPAELFSRLRDQIARHIYFPAELAAAVTATVAIWIAMTYLYCVFPAVPYLYVSGLWASGKTRLLKLFRQLAFRAILSVNFTAASVFRTLDDQGGTVLFDEAQQLRRTNDSATSALLSALLGGYGDDGQVSRGAPGGKRVKHFEIFGPKVLACVAPFTPALASRCIEIAMSRAPSGSPIARRRFNRHSPVWQQLRDDLHALAMEHGAAWLALPKQSTVCDSIDNRDYEIWQPILALAAWFDSKGVGGLFNLVQGFARVSIDNKPEGQEVPEEDAILLRLLAEARMTGERPAPSEILDRAKKVAGHLLKTMQPCEVTWRLKRYGIPTSQKIGGRRDFRNVTFDKLRQVQAQYGLDLGVPKERTVDIAPVIQRRRLQQRSLSQSVPRSNGAVASKPSSEPVGKVQDCNNDGSGDHDGKDVDGATGKAVDGDTDAGLEAGN
jgi:hypothetical protein